jgi:thiamine kinase-like enzyme
MENEINEFGIANLFWEEFYGRHINELTMYKKDYENNEIFEFDNIDDLRQFDSDFLLNVDSDIVLNICNTLNCHPNDITDIKVIQAGLTNVSFKFNVKAYQYVYRHPGGTAGNLIDRRTEITAQMAAKKAEIDKSVIYMDPTGWKISHFVQNIVECNFMKNEEQLKKGMEFLRKFHNLEIDGYAKNFDNVEEGKKLIAIASSTKGNLFNEFKDIIEKVDKLKKYVDEESEKFGMKKVLCHNDVYEPNYISTSNGDLYLIDWEYAGINDPINDISCIICRDDYSFEDAEYLLKAYYDRELTALEHRHAYGYIALCAFYWFCWGLYKGSVGDDDGFFFLPAYRNLLKYIDIALEGYEGE